MADPRTNRYFTTGLPQLPLLTDPKIEPDIRQLYLAIQNLQLALGQKLGVETPLVEYQSVAQARYTIGDVKKRVYVVSSVNITYGEVVNLWDNAGVLNVRLANATAAGLEAHGICNTVGTTLAGGIIEVVVGSAYITSVAGMTRGLIYYTGTVAGTVQNPAPAVVGNVRQAVGVAISPTEMFFDLSLQTQVM